MSTYLLSDIHGDMKHFTEMLNVISFDKSLDNIIILGDVFDRGNDGLELFKFIRKHGIQLIKGNHEYFVELYLKNQLPPTQWIRWGGGRTLTQIEGMTLMEKMELLTAVSNLPLYNEITYCSEKGNKAVLTHSGIVYENAFFNEDGTINVVKSIEESYKMNPFQCLASMDLYHGDNSLLDRFIFVGHTPVMNLHGTSSNRIFKDSNFICLDSGTVFRDKGGCLSCLRIDDNYEFYV